MSEPRRTPGRFAWLLPLAVFALLLSLTPSENQGPRKLPFSEMLTRIEGRQVVRAELSTRDNLLRAWTADDTQYESGYPPDYGTSWSPSSGPGTSRSTSKQTSGARG
jgi:hypothetical protein